MKHIIVVIDGTWVSAADQDRGFSNAYCLNWLLDNRAADDSEQVVFYSSGIGTDRTAAPYVSGATARGIDHQTREAYVNICSNYKHRDKNGNPDKIYLFGFSRGAIVARALSGLISKCGILKPSKMDYFGAVWNAYIGESSVSARKLAAQVNRPVTIEMVGLFDCVFGSLNRSGVFYSLKFDTFEVADTVKAAVHLLSLDDTRQSFAPMLWEANAKVPVLEQIWLPGVQSDVGGTYSNRGLGNVALMTMIDRIHAYTDLHFDARSLKAFQSSAVRGQVNTERGNITNIFSKLGSPRKFIPGHSQYLHPLAGILCEYPPIRYKGQIKSYQLHRSFHDHNTCPYFESFHTPDHDWADYAGL